MMFLHSSWPVSNAHPENKDISTTAYPDLPQYSYLDHSGTVIFFILFGFWPLLTIVGTNKKWREVTVALAQEFVRGKTGWL